MNTCPATFIRANYFSTPLTNSKNQLARINIAGHVFINEIHRVVFPHFRVILRTDLPMALCQTLSPAPKKGKGRQRETIVHPLRSKKKYLLISISHQQAPQNKLSESVVLKIQHRNEISTSLWLFVPSEWLRVVFHHPINPEQVWTMHWI